jgi:MFS family permease
MRTYRELFRTPEFTPFFAASSVQVAASTVSGLALATLVYSNTHSPLLSALSMFGPSLMQMLGAAFLLSAADRLRPRAAMSVVALCFGIGTAATAVPGLPTWAVFAVLAGEGLVASAGGGVRFGLLTEILPKDGYMLGRSVVNMSTGVMQILGFGIGGVLVNVLSPRGSLLAAAGLSITSAMVARFGLSNRPPRATGRPSPAETWRVNAQLWSLSARRYVYAALWVPNGFIVGCEALFVSYDPRHAGLLFAFSAFGMLIGDTLTGRFVPQRWREWLAAPLRLLLAAPYLLFALHPALPVAVVAVTLAAVGYASSLMLQERLIALTPDEVRGQALGLHSSGMLTMQGVGSAIAGAIAQHTSASTAMTVMATASVIVTLSLARGLRPSPVDLSPVPTQLAPVERSAQVQAAGPS